MGLERLFHWLDRLLSAPESRSQAGVVDSLPPSRRPTHPLAALLSVDGAGQYLLCGAERLTLGHVRAGRADLGFLADVGALHAELRREDSLHAGPGWRVQPLGAERVSAGGIPVDSNGRRLEPGDLVRLGEQLEFRALQPDPASASFVLELLRGAECAGARRLVLFAKGPGGRLTIGSTSAHAVRVPGLEFSITLEWHGEKLRVSSECPLTGAFPGRTGELPFPPRERLALGTPGRSSQRPPFALVLEPVELGRVGQP